MQGRIILYLLFVSLAIGANVNTTVGTTSSVFTIPETFLSFNFDWWPNDDPGWSYAGFLNLDIINPLLPYLASKLSPAHLRIGGSLQGTIIYQLGGSGHYAHCTVGRSCLNETRWEQLFTFLKSAGLTLVFGLDEGGPNWNLTNIENLFSYVVTNDYSVYGFEVGNEANTRWSAAQQAQDAKAIQGLLAKYWPNAANRPKLIAPDCSGSDSYWEEYLTLTAGVVEIYTYHAYNGAGGDANLPNAMLTHQFIDGSISDSQHWWARMQKYAPKAEVWMGEGAAAFSSGRDHATNAFESGFYYLNVLGAEAQNGHTGTQRQTLVGGWYELINKTTFHPNPDYYVALLWKQLMGTKVLSTTNDLKTSTRFWAHCTLNMPGAVTVAIINIDTVDNTVTINGLTGQTPRHEYFLSAANDDYFASLIQLNGKLLTLTDNKLPPIDPKIVQDGSPVVVKARNYGYVVFPNANAPACK